MKTWLIRITITIPLLLLFFSLTIYSLLNSQSGSQWLLQKAIKYSGQNIILNGISGSLMSDLNIENFEFSICEASVSISDLDFEWQPHYLLKHKLILNHLTADHLKLDIHSNCNKETTEKNFTLPESITLPLSLELNRLAINEITYNSSDNQPIKIKQTELSINATADKIQLDIARIDYDSLSLNSTFTMLLDFPYIVESKAHWQYIQKDITYQGDLEVKGNSNSFIITHDLTSPYAINSNVVVKNPFGNIAITSNNTWDRIIIPLSVHQSIEIHQGSLITEGNTNKINYVVESFIDTAYANNIHITSSGIASREGLSFQPLNILHEKTNINIKGQLNLSDSLSTELTIIGENIDPSIIAAEYPGNLYLESSINFSRVNERNLLQMSIQNLFGELRGYTAEVAGKIRSDFNSIYLDDLNISVGDNNLKANGTIADTIDLQAELLAPNLNQLHTDLQGDINGNIDLHGTKEKPSIKVDLKSKNIKYLNLVDTNDLNVNINIEEENEQSLYAKTTLSQISVNNKNIEDIEMLLQGSYESHTLNTRLSTQYGNILMNAQGSYHISNQLWQGIFDNIIVSDTGYGNWTNQGPTTLTASANIQTLDSLCLQQAAQTICVNYSSDNTNKKNFEAVLEKFELSQLQSYFDKFNIAQGNISGKANFNTNENSLWVGSAHLDTDSIALTSTAESILDKPITFENLQFSLMLDNISEINLDFSTNYGSGTAHSSIEKLQTIDHAHAQQGFLELDFPDLKFINAYVKNAVIEKGQAKLNMQFNGPLSHLKLKGQGVIDNLDFYLPELGTKYQNAKLTFDASDLGMIDINGDLRAKGGNLSLGGWVSLDDMTTPEYKFTVTGENFPIIDSIDINASITPDLVIQGTSKAVALNGSVIIPRLNIILKGLPNEIDPLSDDEIILDDEKNSNSRNKLSLTGNVDVSLGDHVTFTGYGLQTDLIGGLNISMDEQQSTAGHGSLSMRNASYVKFGQVLDINKGNIIFSGPLDDPSLDIQIQRTGPDVSVTMLISGKADNPQSKLFSEPPLSEANKLSFLLTGRQVNELNSGEGTDLTNAALALGLSQSSSVIQEIGTKFGLDTLSVGAGENGLQSTSLLLGKHLSPRLYVTYAKDIFSAIGAIQMNYLLTDHLSLEVESGTRQTVDLIYSINRD